MPRFFRCLSVLFTLTFAAAAWGQITFSVTDLGPVVPYAINTNGVIVGTASRATTLSS